jgi:hypothetical protein
MITENTNQPLPELIRAFLAVKNINLYALRTNPNFRYDAAFEISEGADTDELGTQLHLDLVEAFETFTVANIRVGQAQVQEITKAGVTSECIVIRLSAKGYTAPTRVAKPKPCSLKELQHDFNEAGVSLASIAETVNQVPVFSEVVTEPMTEAAVTEIDSQVAASAEVVAKPKRVRKSKKVEEAVA